MKRTHIWFAHFAHARKRALERYRITLTYADVEDIAKQIAGGRARFLGYTRHVSASGKATESSVWQVRLGKKKCRVVYDALHDSVVTFLPPK